MVAMADRGSKTPLGPIARQTRPPVERFFGARVIGADGSHGFSPGSMKRDLWRGSFSFAVRSDIEYGARRLFYAAQRSPRGKADFAPPYTPAGMDGLGRHMLRFRPRQAAAEPAAYERKPDMSGPFCRQAPYARPPEGPSAAFTTARISGRKSVVCLENAARYSAFPSPPRTGLGIRPERNRPH